MRKGPSKLLHKWVEMNRGKNTVNARAQAAIFEAMKQGQAQFDSIKEMVDDLDKAEDSGNDQAIESARTRIHEDALTVEVREDWHAPGDNRTRKQGGPCAYEYRILLCTGGPACQIIGTLSEHGEPETATLQVQDWGTPWTTMRPLVTPGRAPDSDDYDSEPVLLTYARQFYFGE